MSQWGKNLMTDQKRIRSGQIRCMDDDFRYVVLKNTTTISHRPSHQLRGVEGCNFQWQDEVMINDKLLDYLDLIGILYGEDGE